MGGYTGKTSDERRMLCDAAWGRWNSYMGVNYGLVLKGEIIERKSFTSISNHVHIALTYICNTICTVHAIYIAETAPIGNML